MIFQEKCVVRYILLTIERMFLHAFLKITIFPVFFSNVKWMYISLESLVIELYLHLKINLDYFPRRLKHAELGKSMDITF